MHVSEMLQKAARLYLTDEGLLSCINDKNSIRSKKVQMRGVSLDAHPPPPLSPFSAVHI
jgi:hypothetical protein